MVLWSNFEHFIWFKVLCKCKLFLSALNISEIDDCHLLIFTILPPVAFALIKKTSCASYYVINLLASRVWKCIIALIVSLTRRGFRINYLLINITEAPSKTCMWAVCLSRCRIKNKCETKKSQLQIIYSPPTSLHFFNLLLQTFIHLDVYPLAEPNQLLPFSFDALMCTIIRNIRSGRGLAVSQPHPPICLILSDFFHWPTFAAWTLQLLSHRQLRFGYSTWTPVSKGMAHNICNTCLN